MNTQSINSRVSIRDKNTGLLLGLLVFVRTMPCYFWAIENTIRPICAIIILAICLTNISKEKWTGYILISFVCAYLWAAVVVDKSSIITVLNFIAFACIPIIREELVFETYKVYKSIFLFFVGLSVLNYVLVLIGLDTSLAVIDPLNSLKDEKYVMHPFLVTYGSSFRFMSIFDEPGYIGTISALMLIGERMNLQKRENIILLIAGIISLSFYFYVAMIFGFLIFSDKLKHKWVYIAILSGLVVATYSNDFLYETIWRRFEYDSSEGKFIGDNRNGYGIEGAYESILGTPLFFTGLGSTIAEEYAGGASLKLIVIKHGFIFVLLNFIGYGLLAFRQIPNKKDWALFMFFFFLTLYQRPGFYATSSIFIYTMLIYNFGEISDKQYERIT